MHGGHTRDHYREELRRVALEVEQLHQTGLCDEDLVQVGTDKTVDLPQGTELGAEGGLVLGRDAEKKGEDA